MENRVNNFWFCQLLRSVGLKIILETNLKHYTFVDIIQGFFTLEKIPMLMKILPEG